MMNQGIGCVPVCKKPPVMIEWKRFECGDFFVDKVENESNVFWKDSGNIFFAVQSSDELERMVEQIALIRDALMNNQMLQRD